MPRTSAFAGRSSGLCRRIWLLSVSLWASFATYALVGVSAGYNVDLTTVLNDRGLELARKADESCVFELTPFVKSTTITKDGRTTDELLRSEPVASIIADNRIGTIRPSAPVLVNHSLLDDTIPYAVGRQLAVDWCARGGNVRLSTNAVPTHLGGMAPNLTESFAFFEARFAGLPQINSCWRL